MRLFTIPSNRECFKSATSYIEELSRVSNKYKEEFTFIIFGGGSINVDTQNYNAFKHWNQENIFKITPNPIKESSFSYEIAIPVKSSNSYIVLFNMIGQMVGRYSINESKGRINFQHKMQAGNYTVRLFVNDKNYANSKIIIAN